MAEGHTAHRPVVFGAVWGGRRVFVSSEHPDLFPPAVLIDGNHAAV
nr:MAG TPA: hypothetical protein [Caudoviricetes sp.]DAI16871.1 MAG TPA: hypothetical protein [Caudoviricetes sp.]DAL60157.1 MAG TPA_asm: hypothetical protein [Caudoviricetes sp.]DAT52142.1 MAG TPA: hypothetical protein [Caudoviricetes sp.]